MPDSSRPLAPELLTVVQQYLERDVSPLLPAEHQFQLRIVARLLNTVRREIELGPTANAAELAGLRALLGHADAPAQAASGQPDGPQAETTALNTQLANGLRNGRQATDDPALLAHLRRTLEDALRINNPKWIAPARRA